MKNSWDKNQSCRDVVTLVLIFPLVSREVRNFGTPGKELGNHVQCLCNCLLAEIGP